MKRRSAQVSTKALGESKLTRGAIDAQHAPRYSQGQIPDLVANTISRSLKAAQGNRSVLPVDSRFQLRHQPAPLGPSTSLFASAVFAAYTLLSLPAATLIGSGRFLFTHEPVPGRP